VASTVFSAQFENLGELVKSLIFPVGVDTFPTELSGRGRFLFRIRKGVKKIVFHNFFMIIEYIYHLNLNNF
jgi:hypothetical protein